MEKKEKKGYGHRNYAIWRNFEELNQIVLNKILPAIPASRFKLRDQIERALTSVGANFIEGYYSGSSREFMRFSRYSRRSLAELAYWITYCFNRKYIGGGVFSAAEDLMIRTGYLIDRLTLTLSKRGGKGEES